MPNIISAKLKELEAARAKVASLEQALQSEVRKTLAALPGKYGFASVEAFVAAVRTACGLRAAGKKSAGGGKKRRRRAVITDQTRAQVQKLVEAGKTGAEIAAQLGISLPSVQNIKKALGLVKKR